MENRIGQLEQGLLARTSSDSHPIGHTHSGPRVASNANHTEIPDQSLASQGPKHSHRPREPASNLSCGPGAFPSSSLSTFLVNDQDVSYSAGPDLVTRGLISQHTLERYFHFYHTCLNPYIYHPLTNVANLLKRSPLLLGAICATAAFCAGSDDKQEIDQPTTIDDPILQEPPYKLECIEMKELAIPDSTQIAGIYSVYSA